MEREPRRGDRLVHKKSGVSYVVERGYYVEGRFRVIAENGRASIDQAWTQWLAAYDWYPS